MPNLEHHCPYCGNTAGLHRAKFIPELWWCAGCHYFHGIDMSFPSCPKCSCQVGPTLDVSESDKMWNCTPCGHHFGFIPEGTKRKHTGSISQGSGYPATEI